MKTTKRFLMAAGVSLALAFTFGGCSSEEGNGDNGGNQGGSNTRCKDAQSRDLFCNWTSGCWAIDPAYSDPAWRECSELVSECQKWGALFTGVSNEGEGVNCANEGGSPVSTAASSSSAGNTTPSSSRPSSSSANVVSSSSRPSSSSSASVANNTRCKDSQNRDYFCNWSTGCWAIDPTYAEPAGQTCATLVANCQKDGTLYAGNSNEGSGVTCSGTIAQQSSNSIAPSSSSAGNTGGVNTRCKDAQGRELSCQWEPYQGDPGGCWTIDPTYSEPAGQSCAVLVSQCQESGTLYAGNSNEGSGIPCNGTIVQQSSNSIVQSSSSVGGNTTPSSPIGVSAVATSSNAIVISWNTVSGAVEYFIYRSTSASGTYSQIGTSTTTSYTNTGLSPATTYYYKVTARNSAGESPQSGVANATTSAVSSSSASVTTPSSSSACIQPPTNVKAAGTNAYTGRIVVTWNRVSGATGYRVYYSEYSGNGPWELDIDGAKNSGTTTHNSPNWEKGVEVYFVVTSVSGNCESAYSLSATGAATR